MRAMVGMVTLWTGYAVGLYGWCLLRGYNVNLAQLVNPKQVWVPTAALNRQGVVPGLSASTRVLFWPPVGAVATDVVPPGDKPVANVPGKG